MRKLNFLLFIPVLLSSYCFSQSGTNDASFNTFNSCQILGGFNNGVRTMIVQADGKIVVGGIFTTYQGSTANRIARLNPDGTLDPSFTASFNFDVNTISLQPDGKIIVGGQFSTGFINGIVRLNSDGSIDPSFNVGTGFNSNAMITVSKIQADGKILVSGGFTSFNGTSCFQMVRLNSNGTLDGSFTNLGFSNPVNSIDIQADGKIVVGGDFVQYNGISRNKIARLNSDGTLDATFNPGTGFNSTVNSISIQPDGKIVVGGAFTTYNGVSRNYIARINTDGTYDSSFNSGSGFNNLVYTTAIQTDGKIIAGGAFSLFNAIQVNDLCRMNVDGSLDITYDPGNGFDNNVKTIAIQSDGKIMVGGDFLNHDGTSRVRISRTNSDGFRDATFNPIKGFNGNVHSTAKQSDGKTIAVGEFTTFNDFPSNRIVRLTPDGEIDLTFATGTGFNLIATVYSCVVQSDGKIVVGGNFTSYQGITRNRIIRLNSDGSVDATFDPGLGFDGIVHSISIQTDGKIVVGGAFTSFNGNSAIRIVRLNSDGSIDPTFNTGSGCNNLVLSTAIQSDGKIIIGGGFSFYNGVNRNFITRLNSDGTLDISFSNLTWTGSSSGTSIRCVKLQTDGKILVGGDFTQCSGQSRNRIVRLMSNGTLDATFNPGTGFNQRVNSIDIQSQINNKLVVVGEFTTFNGISKNRIASLNSNGTIDAGFNQGTGFDNIAYKVLVEPSGKILVAGAFTTFNGICRNGIARLNGSCVHSFGTQNVTACESYTWIDGITYTSNNNSANFVLQNSNGCDSTVSLNLIINNTAIPTGSAQQTFCNSATVNDLVASGTSIQWYASQSGGSPLALSTTLINGTTYYASQTIAGCESSSRLAVYVVINSPAPTGPAEQNFCNGATINDLVATGTSIQWYASQSGGSPLASSTTLLNGTTYYASQTINGCESSSRLSVEVSIFSATSSTITQTACSSFTLNNQTYTQSGVYTQLLTDSQGCDSTITLNLTITQPTSSTINQTSCSSYSLNNETYTQSGVYTQQLSNSQGCDSTITLNLTILPLPSVAVTSSSGVLTANQQNATYQWLDCDNNNNPISGATFISFTPQISGNYAVEINQNSCIDTSQCYAVTVNSSGLGELLISNDRLFPNPNNGSFYFESYKGGNYLITDAVGKVIYSFFTEKSIKKLITITSLPNGVYFILPEGSNSLPLKLVIE